MTLTTTAVWVYGPHGTLIGTYTLTEVAVERLRSQGFVVEAEPRDSLVGQRVEYHGSITEEWGSYTVMDAYRPPRGGEGTRYRLRPIGNLGSSGDLCNVRRQSFTPWDDPAAEDSNEGG